MKKNLLTFSALSLFLLGCVGWFGFGCGKKEAKTPATPPKAVAAKPKLVSVQKTSFKEVTSQLDPGGNFYMYLGTAQWLDQLSTKVEAWRSAFTAVPGMPEARKNEINKAFEIAGRVIKDSGVEDVTGVGMSSIEIEKGMYHNKTLIHHYAGKGTGFLWKLCGQKPHALDGLDLLPTNTVLAGFSDMDMPLLWKVVQREVKKSDFPQAQDLLKQLPQEFEQRTKVKWDDFLHSLGGEAGFALTLSQSNTIPLPLPGAGLKVPQPGLLLVLKVNNDTIFNRIDQELKSNPQVVSVNKAGLKMRTMPVPIPFIGTLRPTAASSGGYLFIASSDNLINEVLKVKSGKLPGLKDTSEFKRLSRDMPGEGNQFYFVSQRFGRVILQIQQQAIKTQVALVHKSAQTKWMNALFHQRNIFSYSVGVNTPQGCLTVGNSSESLARMALVPLAVVPAMLSAIAIPNFVKARATAQRNACINNLRELDAAKQQWALEKGKKPTDVPTKADLMPYLSKWPVCPAGGHYTIGAVDKPPTCSIPGHKLP